MIHVLTNSATFLILILLGYTLKLRGVFQPEQRRVFSFLLLNITIPCALIAGFDTRLDLFSLLGAFCTAALGCLGLDLTSMLLTRRKAGRERAGTLLLSNGYLAAPFTMPFVQANMPAQATMTIAAFDMAQGFFNMGFNYAFAFALSARDNQSRFHPLAMLRNMARSPIILCYVLLLLLSFFKWQLPAPILNFCEKVGGANLFLSMLFAGMVLDLRLDRSTFSKLFAALGVRYGGALLLSLLCFYALPLDTLTARVLTLGFFSPVSTAALAYSERFGADMRVAGAASSLSIVVSMLTFTLLFLVWA